MKVHELIERLLKLPGDARALIEDTDGHDWDVEAVDQDDLDGEKVVILIPRDG